jgi:protein involved in polysaccharide export with SLBB domain
MKKNLSAGLKALLIGALLCLTAQGAVEAQSRSQTASVGAVAAPSVQPPVDYQLAAGDTIHILVFQNPDMTLDTRVSEDGDITYPLIGSNQVSVTGTRDGHPFYRKVDVNSIFLDGHAEDDITLAGGDDVFVPKAQMFYIYGEVNKPGEYPVERNMTVMQALAAGGGPTTRGSEDRIKLSRRDDTGHLVKGAPQLSDAVKPDDVIYVNESFF